MDIIKAPQSNIEAYLHNDLNIEIYEDLTEHEDWKGLFEPLEFFNLLYKEFEFFQTNLTRYLEIKKHYRKLTLKESKRYYFLWALTQLINKAFPTDEDFEGAIEKSCEFMDKLYNEVKSKLYPNEPAQIMSKWSLGNVKKHIETLPDAKAKIKYLKEIKTDYLQNKGFELDWGTPFDEQIQLEIDLQETFLKLETSNKPSHKPIDKLQWKKDSALLAYLFNELKNKKIIEDKNVWQKVAAFFTDKDGKEFKNTDFPNYITSYTKGKTAHDGKKVPKEHPAISDILTILMK